MSTVENIGAKWHSDSGHAWLEVDLRQYPDAVEYGTGFGFLDMDNEVIYLEEDVEAPAFCVQHAAVCVMSMAGRLVSIEHRGDAPCRSLPRNENLLDLPPYTA